MRKSLLEPPANVRPCAGSSPGLRAVQGPPRSHSPPASPGPARAAAGARPGLQPRPPALCRPSRPRRALTPPGPARRAAVGPPAAMGRSAGLRGSNHRPPRPAATWAGGPASSCSAGSNPAAGPSDRGEQKSTARRSEPPLACRHKHSLQNEVIHGKRREKKKYKINMIQFCSSTNAHKGNSSENICLL